MAHVSATAAPLNWRRCRAATGGAPRRRPAPKRADSHTTAQIALQTRARHHLHLTSHLIVLRALAAFINCMATACGRRGCACVACAALCRRGSDSFKFCLQACAAVAALWRLHATRQCGGTSTQRASGTETLPPPCRQQQMTSGIGFGINKLTCRNGARCRYRTGTCNNASTYRYKSTKHTHLLALHYANGCASEHVRCCRSSIPAATPRRPRCAARRCCRCTAQTRRRTTTP